MEEFEDECFSRFVNAQRAEPNEPTAGLAYILASVMARKWQRDTDAKKKIFFCTVRPKDGTTFQSIQYYFNKLLNRNFMKNGFYGYECTDFDDTTKDTKGIHVHFVIPAHSMGKKRMRENIHNTFKDIASIQAIDVRVYPASFRDDKVSYIKGDKWDAQKQGAISATYRFREFHGIDDVNYI